MITKRELLTYAAGFSTMILASKRALAQDWRPTRPVQILIGGKAGSSIDLPVRPVCQRLSKRFGVPFIIDNKPSPAGTVAAETVARSKPDGHTLLIGTNGELINGYFIWQNTGRKFPYDPVSDFIPVALVQRGAGVLVVRPDFGPKSLPDLLEYARKNPGKLNIGTGSIGSTVHLVSELFVREANIDAAIIPYRASADTLLALQSKTIDAMFVTPFEIVDWVERKEAIPLAVSHTKRIPLFPQVETFVELGLPNVLNLPFISFCAPRGTSDHIVQSLNKAVIEEIAGDGPEKPPLVQPGRESPPLTPSELAQFIVDERQRWGDVIKKANIQG
ncbi:tripartite tricarboxylate transporter substrate binding protein [Bradyrhizobium sp. LHD-71]|uniref:Bug family tripartite tricarboxylate transporter substrate binding protein n=1 Tax=Bradyrhizobium sp. LHD-71 TaxID=3072141 RepID=UPI00280F5D75|nr:tripartite tricarboxylate transporter substrate binding protein [Bradyrhizobium sp. LHD-71]MDQ8729821.1 tripartite tricarboxylate transporter substrate binding protein [Bradyrhizobium sp. LHD-71]